MSIELLFVTTKALVVLYFMAIGWSIASSLRKIAAAEPNRGDGKVS